MPASNQSRKRIAKLNRLLGEHLGFIGSNPRYAWRRTAELFYFMQDGTEEVQLESGLYVIAPRYRRCSWADKLGDDLWVLAKWTLPRMSREKWTESGLGRQFPYPHKGQYYAIENAMPGQVGVDVEPSEDDTRQVIARIVEQEESARNPQAVIDACTAEAKKPQADKKREFGDYVDDFWPAFNNEKVSDTRLGVSRGGHVSYGGI